MLRHRSSRDRITRDADLRRWHIPFICSPLEVEVSEVHVAAGQYVYGENVLPFVEPNLEKLQRQIPVVPLTPRYRVCRIICCGDLQRSGCVLSVHID